MTDGVLTSVPNASGSTVRVTELGSPIAPASAEFSLQELNGVGQLDEDSLDPGLWGALFDGIEPEGPAEEMHAQ